MFYIQYFDDKVEDAEPFVDLICGFGKKAKIMALPRVEELFKEFLDKIRNLGELKK